MHHGRMSGGQQEKVEHGSLYYAPPEAQQLLKEPSDHEQGDPPAHGGAQPPSQPAWASGACREHEQHCAPAPVAWTSAPARSHQRLSYLPGSLAARDGVSCRCCLRRELRPPAIVHCHPQLPRPQLQATVWQLHDALTHCPGGARQEPAARHLSCQLLHVLWYSGSTWCAIVVVMPACHSFSSQSPHSDDANARGCDELFVVQYDIASDRSDTS